MRKPSEILAEVKAAIREPYAWPGGYPKYILMADGESISVDAARSEWRSIVFSTLNHARDGWDAYGVGINWEDTNLVCAHTGEVIPSAYGED